MTPMQNPHLGVQNHCPKESPCIDMSILCHRTVYLFLSIRNLIGKQADFQVIEEKLLTERILKAKNFFPSNTYTEQVLLNYLNYLVIQNLAQSSLPFQLPGD